MSTNVTPAEIREVLEMMDHDDPENWTTEGLPRVEVVEALGKFETTRKDITNAAPLFKQGDAVIPVEDDDAAPADEPGPEDEPADEVTAPPPLTDDGPASTVTREGFDREIVMAGSRLADFQKTLTDARAEEARMISDLDALKTQRDREFPPMTPAAAIQAHLRSQLEQRARRAGVTAGLESLGAERAAQMDRGE